jgi:[ribosomal protein S5]-alanine N-acetyltransferase
MWITMARETEAPIGFHVLSHIPEEAFVQVGFFLTPHAWGRGFGTEMARALLSHGFGELALPQIVAIAALDNERSHRVLHKIGLRRNGERLFEYPAYAAMGPLAWFERDREAWLAELTA